MKQKEDLSTTTCKMYLPDDVDIFADYQVYGNGSRARFCPLVDAGNNHPQKIHQAFGNCRTLTEESEQ